MKSVNNIRIILISVICFICVNTGVSQVIKTDYFMKTSYMRSGLNPALQPEQGYLIIPVLPNIAANFQTNNLNLNNLTFRGADGKRVTFMHQSIGTDQFLSNLSTDNYINTDASYKLFALGVYKENGFWSLDLNVRSHADLNIPKPFFGLLKKGFDQEGQSRYDLSDLSATGYAFLELGVSHSRSINDNLTVGARAKLLGGLADFNLDAKSLSIDAGPDYWTAKSKATLRGSASGVQARYDEKDNLDGFDFGSWFNIPGYGLGLDIGAVYDMKTTLSALDGLKVSAAINDIGFIVWTKKNSIDLQSPETEVTIKPSDYEHFQSGGSSLSDVFENAFDDIKKAINLKGETKKTRVTKLRINMNVGAEYEILKDKLSAGALYSIRFGNYFNLSEFVVSLNYRPSSWISTSTSYSIVHSNFDTFGVALHLTPAKGIHFFLASDYAIPHISSEFLPTTSRALNFQMGISIPFGNKKNTK